jgi:hypothetical protein
MTLKPLRNCLQSIPESIRRDYDLASADKLFELIIECDFKLAQERSDSKRVDALRAVIWFANAALCRKGVPPSDRTCLGSVPTTTPRLLHRIRKADAPYIDLQWLGYRRPETFPKKWSGCQDLIGTAPGLIHPPLETETIALDPIGDEASLLDIAFDAADRVIGRQDSIADKCRQLGLSPLAQMQNRWLCSRSSSQLRTQLEEKDTELRKAMRAQGIKQLTEDLIEQRLVIYRAWKLAGGGDKWQAAADTFKEMTGRSITRQGIRDMITRMGEQKLIRRRRGRVKTAQAILTKD